MRRQFAVSPHAAATKKGAPRTPIKSLHRPLCDVNHELLYAVSRKIPGMSRTTSFWMDDATQRALAALEATCLSRSPAVRAAANAHHRQVIPSALATIASPLRFSGWSSDFEAVINSALYQDDVTTPLVTGATKGGSNGYMGPISTPLYFEAPTHPFGMLVVSVNSAKDGSVLEASATRVAFAH